VAADLRRRAAGVTNDWPLAAVRVAVAALAADRPGRAGTPAARALTGRGAVRKR